MAAISISKAEKSYVQASLLASPPVRSDGRSLSDFRTIALETGVAPLANGSAKLSIGRNGNDGGGGTEVIAAVKLEVEDIQGGEGVEGGRVVCVVSWYDSLRGTHVSRLNCVKTVLQQHTPIYLPGHWTTFSMI